MTVDYADMAAKIKRMLEEKVYKLVEAMAEDAARLALADKKVKAVSVKILKKALSGIDGATVEVRRTRR
jgi:dihydroneopterin aldolase